jgi:hypothetical protein
MKVGKCRKICLYGFLDVFMEREDTGKVGSKKVVG